MSKILNNGDRKLQQEQVDNNFEKFKQMLPQLLNSHLGTFALMKDGNIIEFFESFKDAERAGNIAYQDGIFSIQKVENKVINLGMFAYA